MSLPESLERAASELPALAEKIRPANGDPHRLLEELSPDEAGQLLFWSLNEEADAAAGLIEVWAESDRGASILLGVSDRGIPKVARKLLRTARHRLRSRGVDVAPLAEAVPAANAEPASRRMTSASDRWHAAHLSIPDFRGARVGYLVDSHPGGGARLFEIRFDDTLGILDFKIYNAGRSKVRGFLRSLTSGTEQRLFEVERDPLRAIVRRASLAQPVDRPLPSSFVEWRGRLFPEDLDQQATPGELARTALREGTERIDLSEALETTLGEIRDGRLGPWPPQSDWVAEWVSKGREATEGLEGKARANAIEAWIDESTESLRKETDACLLAYHLDEMAWVRWQSDAESSACALLAVSEAIAQDGEELNRLSRARVEGLFSSLLIELRVDEQSGLDLADPDEASG